MAYIKKVGRDRDGRIVWDVRYRRTQGGKQVHRRLKAMSKTEVERMIALDSSRTDIFLKWSEGLGIYVQAKRNENRSPVSIGHAERAVAVFTELISDIEIERTTPDTVKQFMQLVANGATVHDVNRKPYKVAGAKVANHHRKELITIARYLLRHAGKITDIPFINVPPLPVRKTSRQDIPSQYVIKYLQALPSFLERPLRLVLYYGLRSTAICNLLTTSVANDILTAVDKNNVEHRIPIDDMLRDIINDAIEYRSGFNAPSPNLFVNDKGRSLDRTTFLRSCQRRWHNAGLEKRKIHEFRHTLGTIAGKKFPLGMVQAAMRHSSRNSSESYFHPSEEMAAEVRKSMVTELEQKCEKTQEYTTNPVVVIENNEGVGWCPCCNAKLLILKKKGRKSN